MPKVPITDNVVPFSGAPAGPMPSETDFAMAAATMHAQGRLFESGSQIRDEEEGSVLEENLGKEGADTIKSMDKLMEGPYKKNWDNNTRQRWIDQQQREKNKDQYPTPGKPMHVELG